MQKIFLLLTLSLCITTNVFAQENMGEVEQAALAEIASMQGSTDINCFDYYKFQSVQVSVDTNKKTYIPKSVVKFDGNIINTNEQPITDGAVFVRISQDNANYHSEGRYNVSEFFALKDISLKAKETKKIQFDWQVPQYISAGKYHVDLYFVVGDKFNLGGLPFTNEIIAGSIDFDILSNEEGSVFLKKNSVKINEEEYQHIGSWPVIEQKKEVIISYDLINDTNSIKDVEIIQELYFWDSLNEKDKKDIRKQTVTLQAGEVKTIEYQIPSMNESVYYLKTTSKYKDQESIINVRLLSEMFHPRLNYPALTTFPIKQGDSSTLFTCFHNTSDVSGQGRVEVVLTDDKGVEISKINYDGVISSQMSADKSDFVAAEDLENIILNAKIYDENNNIIDEYVTEYKCEDFDGCIKQSNNSEEIKDANNDNSVNTILWIVIGVTTIVIIFILISAIIKKNKK
jgi:hypothetical protein